MKAVAPEAGIRFETICEMPAFLARADDPAVRLAGRLAEAEATTLVAFGTEAGLFQKRRHPDRGLRPRPHRPGAPGRRVRVARAARRRRALPAGARHLRAPACGQPLRRTFACLSQFKPRAVPASNRSARWRWSDRPAAGKTSLAEALLRRAGAIGAAGQPRARHHGQRLRPARAAHAAFAQRRVLHLDARRHAHPLDRHARARPTSSASALPALEAVETAAIVINAATGIEPMARAHDGVRGRAPAATA